MRYGIKWVDARTGKVAEHWTVNRCYRDHLYYKLITNPRISGLVELHQKRA